jgi:flavin reductase (DIM6/NTAB) family NADH-FMN oxidoreductase RutF
MSNAACTVSVVTTNGPGGRFGVTVSAMSSVTADTPEPTLLVCINSRSPAAQAIIENGVFCVNVLKDDQWFVSDCFAGRYRTHDGDRFSCTNWKTDVLGSPRVERPLASFSCKLASSQKIGTHHVFFGSVLDIVSAESGSPLIYANRAYGTPTRLETQTPPEKPSRKVTSDTLKLGAFHTFGPYIIPRIVQGMMAEGMHVDLKLIEGDQNRVVDALKSGVVDLALVYDFDLGPEIAAEPLTSLDPYVLIAANHPLAAYTTISLADLVDWPLILLDAPPSGRYFKSLFKEKGLKPQVQFQSTSFEMVRGLVAHGLGYSLLATKPASSMSYDGRALTVRSLFDRVPASHLVLATRRDSRLKGAAAGFAVACRTMISLPEAEQHPSSRLAEQTTQSESI